MVKYEDQCVGCDFCIGAGCAYKEKVPVYYCDECKEEIEDDVYDVDDKELCECCTLKKFRRG